MPPSIQTPLGRAVVVETAEAISWTQPGTTGAWGGALPSYIEFGAAYLLPATTRRFESSFDLETRAWLEGSRNAFSRIDDILVESLPDE